MKKSIIIIIAASVVTLGGAGGGVAYYLTHKPHVHTFEDTWSYNDSRHWYAATCEHKTLNYGTAAHTMGEWSIKTEATCSKEGAEARACSVCGYEEVRSLDKVDHTYATEWSMDESGHWHAATCEHTNEKSGFAAHTYNYGERACNVCEYLDSNPRGTELKVQNDIIDVSKVITIPNQTSVFSINSLLQVAETAKYTLYSDYACTRALTTGTMVLAEGDNTFYVKVQNGGIKDIYSITLHRNRLYTVTFDTAGGTDVEAQTVEENSVLTTPPTTERTGYTFSAWDYDFSQPVTSDITAMASWTANSYLLTFDADGGTVESSGLAVAYDSVCNLPTPTKNGYVFDGWYNGEAKLTSGFTWQATSDVELKAKWTAKTYKVSFTDGKGVCTQTQISVTYDSEFELPRNLSLTGYTFAGWFNGETEITDGVWTYDTITSLTAKWTANTYTVNFDANGGQCKTTEITATYEQPCYYPQPTRTGYTFVGWYKDTVEMGLYGTPSWDEANGAALTAKWEAKTYQITLTDPKGVCKTSEVYVTYDASYTLPGDLSFTGYTFDGWYADDVKTDAEVWESDTITVLTAKWTANTYTLTFDANDGECTTAEMTVTFDKDETLPTPTYYGYVFQGWYYGENAENKVENGKWNITSDLALTAKWKIDENVSYKVLHYQQNITDDEYTLVDTEDLFGTSFASVTPALKTYDGFTAKQTVKTVEIEPDDSSVVKYYYDRNTVTVTFVTNNGQASVQKSFRYDYPANSAFVPERQGVSFGGWYTDAALTTPAPNLTKDTTLYAYWNGETKPGEFTYSVSGGKITLTAFSGAQADVVIPAYINDCPVTTIGADCFEVNESYRTMKNVTLPETLTSISGSAFGFCQLDTLNVRDLAAFCAVNLPNRFGPVQHTKAFCVNGVVVKDLVIPEGATSIGEFIFASNTLFTSVSFPKSLKSIGEYAFSQCTSLKTVSFARESQCQTINRYAFDSCYSLTSIVVPSSVTKLFADAFDDCSNVTVYFRIAQKPESGWIGNFTTPTIHAIVWGYTTTSYRVEYYQENADDDDYTLFAEETYKGDEIVSVTPEVYTYTGFKSPTAKTVEIVEDTTTVIQYFYERNSFTVTFDAGEETVEPIKVKYGQNVTLPSPAPVTGYSYAWYDGVTKAENGVWLITEDKALKILWTANDYTVNFNANEGTCGTSSITVTYDASYEFPSATRTGYNFLGWHEGENKIEDGVWTYTADKDLVAKWSVITYTVTLDANGGSCDEESVSAYYDINLTLPDASYIGYIFEGWYDGTTKVQSGTWSYTEDKTLTAKWTIIKNTLSFNADGGNCATTSMTVTYFEEYELPTPTRTGYEFLGWFDGDTQLTDGTWAGTSDLSLTAKWNVLSFAVTFVSNGGSAIPASSIAFGTSLSSYVPVRENFTFGGWYSDVNLTSKVLTVPSEAVTLYAKWNEETSPTLFTYTENEGKITIVKFNDPKETSIGFPNIQDAIKSVRVPAFIGGKPVTAIGDNAFVIPGKNNTFVASPLISITIPDSITTIGSSAFQNCRSMPSFTLPASVVSIGEYAFDYCTSLSTFTFAEGSWCSSIGYRAFGNCPSISSITFPESVATVGNSVFYFCQGLTSFTVPKNLTAISAGMFWNCSSLKSVTFAEGSKCSSIGETAFKYCKNLTEIVIPNTVLSIGNNAFEECTSLPYIIIPSSVTTVGVKIFYSDSQVYVYCEAASKPAEWDSYWCKYLYDPYYYYYDYKTGVMTLYYVDLPSGHVVWNFADKVRLDFETNGGNALSFVTLTKGADLSGITPSRAGYTFDGWYADPDMQTQVTAAPNQSTTLYAKWAGETAPSLFSYTETDDSVTITKYNGTETEVGIPTCVNGKKVTAIANEAFMNTAVVSVTIPNGVTTVGARAFCGCSVLTNVTFLSQSCCTSIGQSAFMDCTSLSSITIPLSVATIGKEVFTGDEGIQIYCHATAKPEGWDTDWLVGATDATVTWDCADAHTVSFITNGGEALAPASIKYGASPADYTPVRAGYSFGGWYLDAGLKTAASAIPDCDTTVYARWNEETATSLFTYTESNTAVTVTKYNGSETNVVVPAFIGDKPVCEIGAEAFKNSTAVVSVSIPASVKVIGDYAFYGCSALNTFTFAEGSLCTTVWSYAFQGCSSLCAITLPDTVWQFGYYSFAGCTSLSSFTVPAEVIDLDKGMFSGDTNLTTVTFAAGSKCAVIGEKAFSGCTKLTTLVIPDAVKEIQKYAFENCTSLSSIIIPISVTTIGTHIFYGVGGVQVHCMAEDKPSGWDNNWCAYDSSNTHLPDNQIEWAYGFDKYQVTFVTNGGSAIASRPYKEGRDLTKFVPTRTGYTFDGWYTDIGLTVDISAVGTEDVTVYAKWEGETNTSLFTYAESDGRVTVTAYTGTETNVVVPAYINGSPVCEIGAEAFKNTAVISVYVSGLVEAIGDCAFSGCTALSAFNIPLTTALSTIGSGAFDGCTSLSEFVIPASVTTVGAIVFSGVSGISIHCKALEQPEGWNNQWLNGASDATVSWGWVETYAVTFVTNGGDALPSVALPYGSTLSSYEPTRTGFTFGGWYTDVGLKTPFSTVGLVPVTVYARWNEETSTSFFSYTVSDGKVTITKFNDPNATNDGKSIKNVSIPAYIGGYPVTDIGAKAFVIDAPQNVIYQSRITSLTLPETLVNIGDAAFKYCRNITAVTIPASVLVIGDRAFAECNSLKTFVFAEGTALTHIWSFAFERCYALTAIDLPDTVIQLGDYTFAECTSLTSIRIPAGVKLIHSGMFYKDTNLKTITFAEGFAPSAIGHDAFNNCTSLTAIEIPTSVKTIEYSAFSGCSSLTSIVIPNGVSSIEDGVFSGCSSLASVSLPNTVTVIKVEVFNGCTSLVSIELPHSLTEIQSSAFYGCTSLSSFVLPNSVTGIGNTIFKNCTSLSSFVFEEGAKCSYIGSNVFENCTSLSSIVLSDCITYQLGNRIFYGCSDNLIIYCEFDSKPSGWLSNWNVYKGSSERIPESQIVWGYTGEES